MLLDTQQKNDINGYAFLRGEETESNVNKNARLIYPPLKSWRTEWVIEGFNPFSTQRF